MKKWLSVLSFSLALGILAVPLAAEPIVNVARVGFLSPTDWCPANDTRSEAFLQGLSELGYQLGKNVVFECRAANGRYEQPLVSPDLTPKRLQLLKEAAPKASRVAMLWNPTHPASRPQLNEAEIAARQLGVRLQPVAASDAGDLASAFATMAKARAEALLVFDDTMLSSHAARIAALAARNGLPTMSSGKIFPARWRPHVVRTESQ